MQCEKNSGSENAVPVGSKILDKKRRFKCPQCDYHNQFLCIIQRHAVIHSTEPGKHACLVSNCNYRTYSPYNLKNHVRRRHEEVLKPVGIRSWNFCTKCDFRTKYPSVLKKHALAHEETKPIACSFAGCSFRSNWQSSVYTHERRQHHSELKNQFACSFLPCEFSAYSKYELETHMLTHSDDRPFVCFFPGCNYKAKQAKNLTAHQKQVHDQDRVKDKECTFCAKKFFTENALSTHIKAHLDEKPYSCSYPNCDVRRVHKSAIKAHEITHRNEKNVHCDHLGCNFKTKNAPRLRIHKAIHDPNRSKNAQCILCQKKFYNESGLRIHMLSHTQERPHKCPSCDYSASVPAKLKFHRCFRKNPQLQLPTKSSSNSSKQVQSMKIKYECELCEYATKHSRNVTEHIMSIHIERLEDAEDGAKRYKCRECERISDCFSTAKKHCRTHNQVRPVRCTFGEGCDFQARLIRQLQKHMKEAHKAERVLPTTYCEQCKRLVSTRHWNIHLKSHVEPFNCMICGYSTRFHSKYFRHIEGKQHQKNARSLASNRQ